MTYNLLHISITPIIRLWSFASIVLMLVMMPVATAQSLSDNEVKAALVLKLPQYITFQESLFESDKSDLLIGVLGDKDYVSSAKKIYKGAKVQGRNVKFINLNDEEALSMCHVVYIDSSAGNLGQNKIASILDSNAVTISNNKDFTANGGMVRLYLKDRKYAIEINVDAVERKTLVFSSQLLRIATILRDKNKNAG